MGKVPVLVDDDRVVWDTLAIAEYLAEKFPEKSLWPRDAAARARARSVCAEMHSGFAALRGACPMNIEADLPDVGALAWRDKPAVRADVQRIVAMWTGLLAEHGAGASCSARSRLPTPTLRPCACASKPTPCPCPPPSPVTSPA